MLTAPTRGFSTTTRLGGVLKATLLLALTGQVVACKARQNHSASAVRADDGLSGGKASGAGTPYDTPRTVADDINGALYTAYFSDGTTIGPNNKSSNLDTYSFSRARFPCTWQKIDNRYESCKIGTLHADLEFTVVDPLKPATVDVLVELLYGEFIGEDFGNYLEIKNGLTKFELKGFHDYNIMSSEKGRPTYQMLATIPANSQLSSCSTTFPSALKCVKASVGFHSFSIKRLAGAGFDVRLSIKRNLPSSGYPITPEAFDTYARTMYLTTGQNAINTPAANNGNDPTAFNPNASKSVDMPPYTGGQDGATTDNSPTDASQSDSGQ